MPEATEAAEPVVLVDTEVEEPVVPEDTEAAAPEVLVDTEAAEPVDLEDTEAAELVDTAELVGEVVVLRAHNTEHRSGVRSSRSGRQVVRPGLGRRVALVVTDIKLF